MNHRPLLCGALVLLLAACGADTGSGSSDVLLVAVRKGSLAVSVTEGGDLESANPVSITNEIEGRTTILELIPEGKFVEEGEVLAVLDSSGIENQLNRQEIEFGRALSSHEKAKETLEIQKKQNEEQLESARVDQALATRALEAYRTETFPLDKVKLVSKLTLARERETRAKDKFEGSQNLHQKKHISRTELEADELAWKQAREEVDIAERELRYLEEVTKLDQEERLESDKAVKTLAFERVKQQAASNLIQRMDELATAKRQLELEQEARDKLVAQKGKTRILAPAAGLVVYGRRSGGRWSEDEPMAVGREVREREEILRIPVLENMIVEVDIHESAVTKVRAGQRAIVRIDAIPDRSFVGTVKQVSLVPSSQSSWMNPDLKVYVTKVALDEKLDGAKPGMHAQVKIMVAEIPDALLVPIPAVRQSGARSFVYVKSDAGTELREITVGANNETSVEVLKGLKVGELVWLVPPADADELPKPAEDVTPEGVATSAPVAGEAPGVAPGGPQGAGMGQGSGRPSMTPEQLKAFQERMEKMTPQEREAFMKARRGSRPGGPGSTPKEN